MAIDRDRLIVGAPNEDSASTQIDGIQGDDGNDQGAAYVFERDAQGAWSEVAYLKATDQERAAFGDAVDISEDAAVVSARYESKPGETSSSGAVYVFRRDAQGVWTRDARLVSDNLDARDLFGDAVAVDQDIVVVSAPGEDSNGSGVAAPDADDNSLSSSGAVYVFERDAQGQWTQEVFIKAEISAEGAGFGRAVDIDSNQVAITQSGRVHLYVRDAQGVWVYQRSLSHVYDSGDMYGFDVAISGDLVVTGAENEDSSSRGLGGDPTINGTEGGGENSGAAFIYGPQPAP